MSEVTTTVVLSYKSFFSLLTVSAVASLPVKVTCA